MSDLKDELRSLFLFESLTDEQLDWLVDHGSVESHEAGVVVYEQGDLAECFYVLLEGEIQLEKRLDGTDVMLTTSDLPGSYAGATRAFVPGSQDESYTSSLRAITQVRLFRLRAEDFAILTAHPDAPARAVYTHWGWRQHGIARHTDDADVMDQLVIPLQKRV